MSAPARRTAVVICPGRGSYGSAELGVLGRSRAGRALLARLDPLRVAAGQEPLSALDGAARYAPARHGRGDNASALIYAATLADRTALDPGRVEVVAVTGNSMGWYSALACAGALGVEQGFTLANTMGVLMSQARVGGQTLYPFLADDWRPDPETKARLLALVAAIAARPGHVLTLSIDLGGMLVLAGNTTGLRAFEAAVPPVQGRFPLRLANHAAFHSALQQPVAERARAALGPELFGPPRLPLIDGRGAIWWPGATDPAALRDYTLDHQVTQPYDFTRAVTVAAREFAPDLFILTGPGSSLGGAVAQALILAGWQGLDGRAAFQRRQETRPLLVAMGRPEQRRLVATGEADPA